MKCRNWAFSGLVLACCLAFGGAAHADNTTYYVDASAGSDTNDGLTAAKAWKSLDKVNTVTFQPGDQILLKAGERWTGTLHPLGSGAAGNPIVISRYGTGSNPLIEGQGARNVVMLYNQEHWDVGHLEITNKTATQGTTARSGVEVIGEDYMAGPVTDITNVATLHNIRLHDLYIHDINGQHIKTVNGSAGINVVVKRRGDGQPNRVTKFDQVLIENNKIENVTRTGIMVNSAWGSRAQQGGTVNPQIPWTPATNVVIRGNQVLHVSGDGIVPHVSTGALVEYNRVHGFNEAMVDYNAGMWTYNGDYTLYQYNEVSGGKTIKDGMAFDFDNGTKGLIFQYNYSHDNEGGTVLICQNETNGSVSDGIFRYNISQNDKYQMITVCGGSNYTNMQFYNNVFYVGSGIANNMLINNNGNAPAGNGQVCFKNNIFYNLGTGSYAAKQTWTYDSNVFFGNNKPTTSTIPDANMITADPRFVNPGTGTGIDGLDGYKLMSGSSALTNGAVIANNGGKDFWGNPVSAANPPHRGAYNGSPELLGNPGFETGTENPWYHWGSALLTTNASEVRTGKAAAKVVPNSAFEQWVTVKPNTTYKLRGYGKVSGAGETISIGAKLYDGNKQTAVQITDTSWSQKEITFTTGPSTTTMRVFIYNPSASGYGLADDVELYEQ
ncbi:carbohydrate binding domain-containing protein [Paenibacillus sp. GD4]|uniref:carbohydrate binding domain-containing protein n=1 Tax=Paenibacillus sp. GD4 TaxID=3068890 RepID=UPI002796A7DB|nr:carbohydrate binding domain-containing protein [Paenibacillus sp. GD4]MDQ1914776.1 carbohydrate binding domain-containing protein [Paenibacillus sp. GD4]